MKSVKQVNEKLIGNVNRGGHKNDKSYNINGCYDNKMESENYVPLTELMMMKSGSGCNNNVNNNNPHKINNDNNNQNQNSDSEAINLSLSPKSVDDEGVVLENSLSNENHVNDRPGVNLTNDFSKKMHQSETLINQQKQENYDYNISGLTLKRKKDNNNKSHDNHMYEHSSAKDRKDNSYKDSKHHKSSKRNIHDNVNHKQQHQQPRDIDDDNDDDVVECDSGDIVKNNKSKHNNRVLNNININSYNNQHNSTETAYISHQYRHSNSDSGGRITGAGTPTSIYSPSHHNNVGFDNNKHQNSKKGELGCNNNILFCLLCDSVQSPLRYTISLN